ncbi:MAG: hypothetical protein QGF92_08665, partial [Gammaproteobacteria bacterium]|nr:hypothetical protein [Gammaproteobacteria bacterium]
HVGGDTGEELLVTLDKSNSSTHGLSAVATAAGAGTIGTGTSVVFLDQDSGEITHEIRMDRMGWAAVASSIDPGYLLLGNFFDGEFVKLRVDDGKIVARNTINEERSLSGIAQYPGPLASH